MEEKAIAKCIQAMHEDQQEARESISVIDCALSRVAYKETQPEVKGEAQKPNKEPENITEALARLAEGSKNIRGLLSQLSSRANSLF